MNGQLRKPILVGGVTLSLGLWLWDSLQHSLIEVGEWSLLGAMTVGAGFWLLRAKTAKKQPLTAILLPVKREEVEQAIATINQLVKDLEAEAPEHDISELKQEVEELPTLLERQELKIAITGGKTVGKTSLTKTLAESEFATKIDWLETEALLTEKTQQEITAKEKALTTDLVLFVVAGDLTDAQWQILQQLKQSRQRVLLIFNKQDLYAPEEKIYIEQQLQQRVAEIIAPEDVIAISTVPKAIKVLRQQEDGSVQESIEQPEAQISNLNSRLITILAQEREQLIWVTTWRRAIELKQQAQEILNQVRRDRALPIIEQYQWIAAGAAFANPVAALDLLATAAISTQMLVDLGGIYRQKFSVEQAQTATGTLGKLMVQLGLVELSTQAIAGILKSNAFTYVAGGAVQGVSAAYLTRIAGLSLIEYFQEQEVNLDEQESFNLARFTAKLQQVFQQNQRKTFLNNFVQNAISRLSREKETSSSATAS
jgi:GTPase SAR1 family protein